MKTVIFFILLFVCSNINAIVTVGTDINCDFTTIHDAYLTGDEEIRVTSQEIHRDVFTIDKTVWITGSYDTCNDANSNNLGNAKSIWMNPLNQNGTIVTIINNQPTNAHVTIDFFDLDSGKDISPNGAGGMKIIGNSTVVLNSVTIHHSRGILGGGIHISGSDARVTIDSSNIQNNVADNHGGGVYCENQATVLVGINSQIYQNHADDKGGGIFATESCEIYSYTGDSNSISDNSFGINFNEAMFGGGIYAEFASKIYLYGNSFYPSSVLANLAQEKSTIGGLGAGIFLTDANTSLTALNAKISGNTASNQGGGIYATNQASFTIERLDDECWNNEVCSSMTYNVSLNSGVAGLAYIGNRVEAEISQTNINKNWGSESALLYLDTQSQLTLEGNLIFDNHGDSSIANNLIEVGGGANGGARLNFHYNTLTDNMADTLFKINTDTINNIQTLNLFNSIIWDEATVISTTGNTDPVVNIDSIIVSDVGSLIGNIGATITSNPNFIDAKNGDYHLAASSPAIDLCSEIIVQSQHGDLNGNDRGFDVDFVNNIWAYDAGAYEVITQVNPDIVFYNGFE